ncbi:MAG: hypothetical protein U0236_18615 [Nitrospira sp.]
MDLIVGEALTCNVLVNGAALVLVVAQRIEYLREGQVGEADKNLFGRDSNFHNSAMARTGMRVPATMGVPWRMSSEETI